MANGKAYDVFLHRGFVPISRSTPYNSGSTIPFCDWYLPLRSATAGFARLVGREEQNLAKSFVGLDARRKRCRVGDFERNKALPLRLKSRDVHDDAAAGIAALAHANRKNIAGN